MRNVGQRLIDIERTMEEFARTNEQRQPPLCRTTRGACHNGQFPPPAIPTARPRTAFGVTYPESRDFPRRGAPATSAPGPSPTEPLRRGGSGCDADLDPELLLNAVQQLGYARPDGVQLLSRHLEEVVVLLIAFPEARDVDDAPQLAEKEDAGPRQHPPELHERRLELSLHTVDGH